MSGSEVAGLVRYDDASLDGLRSLSAMAESEDYASAGRASGGEKLAERREFLGALFSALLALALFLHSLPLAWATA